MRNWVSERPTCPLGAVAASPHPYAQVGCPRRPSIELMASGRLAVVPSMGTKAGGAQYRLGLLASRQLVTQDLNVPSQKSLHSLTLSQSPTQPFEPRMEEAERRNDAGSTVFLLGPGGPHDGILLGPSTDVHL